MIIVNIIIIIIFKYNFKCTNTIRIILPGVLIGITVIFIKWEDIRHAAQTLSSDKELHLVHFFTSWNINWQCIIDFSPGYLLHQLI